MLMKDLSGTLWGFTEHESHLQVCLMLLNCIMKHHLADFGPNLSRQPTTSDLVLLIHQHVLKTGAPDAMLNKLKEKGIKSIKDLELVSWISFLQYLAPSATASVKGSAIWLSVRRVRGLGSQSYHCSLGLQLLLWQRLPKKYWKQSWGAECDREQGVTGAVSPIQLGLAVAEATGSRLCAITGCTDNQLMLIISGALTGTIQYSLSKSSQLAA